MKFLFYALLVLIIPVLLSCSGKSENSHSGGDETVQAQESQDITSNVDKTGENLYLKYCMACHQTDGSGVPGMYPPLVNSFFF